MQLPLHMFKKVLPKSKNYLTVALEFIGSLIPIIFPNQKFNPKRLLAVVVILALLGVSTYFLGIDATESIVDLTEPVMGLTEE